MKRLVGLGGRRCEGGHVPRGPQEGELECVRSRLQGLVHKKMQESQLDLPPFCASVCLCLNSSFLFYLKKKQTQEPVVKTKTAKCQRMGFHFIYKVDRIKRSQT